MCKIKFETLISEKGRLPTFCGSQNRQTPSFLYIFDTNYNIFVKKWTFASYWMNFSPKLANVLSRQNVVKRTPPNLGGSNDADEWPKTNCLTLNYETFLNTHERKDEIKLRKFQQKRVYWFYWLRTQKEAKPCHSNDESDFNTSTSKVCFFPNI